MPIQRTVRRLIQEIDRRVPAQVPRLAGYPFFIFHLIWWLLLVIAVLAPIGGLYLQASRPARMNNSYYLLGSSIGLALDDENDARTIIGPVGDVTRRAGIHSGDKLLAVGNHRVGVKLVRSSEILRSDSITVPLTIRKTSGDLKRINVVRGEDHFNSEVHRRGIAPWVPRLVGELYILFYPLLLWIAIALHYRNKEQPVPELFSISLLLFVCFFHPASLVFSKLGVPTFIVKDFAWLSVASFIAALLLFPDARLKPRTTLIPLLILPTLFALHGTAAAWAAAAFFCLAIITLMRRVRGTSGIARQQLKFLSMGIGAALAILLIAALTRMLIPPSESIEHALVFAATSSIGALAIFLVIPVLLLFASLRRLRLYDAEELFSRSAVVAALTICVALFFAVTSRILDTSTQGLFYGAAGAWSSVIAGAAAVLLVKPAQRRIQDWTERHFQRHLFELRNELPERMEDLRETATVAALLEVALGYVVRALRVDAAAAVVDNQLIVAAGVQQGHARRWLRGRNLSSDEQLNCDRNDPMFPVRLPLKSGSEHSMVRGWILVGRRPDGSIISSDERKALGEVEEPIARAVEVARQREHLSASERRWKERQESRLRALERSVEALVGASSPERPVGR